jgi:peptidoglycan hydrolase CwlO-like protein
MTENATQPPTEDSRLARLESEVRGLKKFVTTLEVGHENRAKQWNKKITELTADVKELKDRVRKTRKKVKKLAR